MGSRAENRE
jgi:hypothetical protein